MQKKFHKIVSSFLTERREPRASSRSSSSGISNLGCFIGVFSDSFSTSAANRLTLGVSCCAFIGLCASSSSKSMVLRLVAVLDGGVDGGKTVSSVENRTEAGLWPEKAWPFTPLANPLPWPVRTGGVLGDADVDSKPADGRRSVRGSDSGTLAGAVGLKNENNDFWVMAGCPWLAVLGLAGDFVGLDLSSIVIVYGE